MLALNAWRTLICYNNYCQEKFKSRGSSYSFLGLLFQGSLDSTVFIRPVCRFPVGNVKIRYDNQRRPSFASEACNGKREGKYHGAILFLRELDIFKSAMQRGNDFRLSAYVQERLLHKIRGIV